MNNFLEGFFEGKKIFLTGHTGFKGSWLSLQLHSLGSIVTGYSLEPPTKPSLYEMARVNDCVDSIYGDICNFEQLNKSIIAADPDIEENEYYWSDLIGTKVITTTNTELGTIVEMRETGANDVLVIDTPQRRLIPYTDDAIQQVDKESNTITVDWDPDF